MNLSDKLYLTAVIIFVSLSQLGWYSDIDLRHSEFLQYSMELVKSPEFLTDLLIFKNFL